MIFLTFARQISMISFLNRIAPQNMTSHLWTIFFSSMAFCSCSPCNDSVSEWLRRWTRNPLGSAREGSNPFAVAFASQVLFFGICMTFHFVILNTDKLIVL